MARYQVLLADLLLNIVQYKDVNFGKIFQNLKKQLSSTTAALNKAVTQAAKNTQKQSLSIVKSLNRTVSGFDQLNKLAKKNVGSTLTQQSNQILESAGNLVDKVGQLGQQIKGNVVDPISNWATGEMADRVDRIGQKLSSFFTNIQQNLFGIQAYTNAWDQLNLKTDFWRDLVERTNQTTALFTETLGNSGLAAGRTSLEMKNLNVQVQQGSGMFAGLQGSAQSTWENIRSAWGGSGSWFSQFVTAPVGTAFSGMLSKMERDAGDSWGNTKTVFSDAGGFFTGVFSDAWGKVMDVFSKDGDVFVDVQNGVLSGFKAVVNDLIDGINQVSTVPFGGLNKALDKLQNIKIGNLQPFSFLQWRATVPKIPHLAQGAVLPANRPFLAMVGDQRHGTNIEAPLATIQEAVAGTMEDFAAGNMAGHEATVELLGRILEAVMGIQIGDATVAAACDRYNRQMHIITGR